VKDSGDFPHKASCTEVIHRETEEKSWPKSDLIISLDFFVVIIFKATKVNPTYCFQSVVRHVPIQQFIFVLHPSGSGAESGAHLADGRLQKHARQRRNGTGRLREEISRNAPQSSCRWLFFFIVVLTAVVCCFFRNVLRQSTQRTEWVRRATCGVRIGRPFKNFLLRKGGSSLCTVSCRPSLHVNIHLKLPA